MCPRRGGRYLQFSGRFLEIPAKQQDGLVLVDAGGTKGDGARLVDTIRTLSNKPVKAVIISQWHGDKPQGLSEILKAWPQARTISTSATQVHLRDPATMNTPGQPDPVKCPPDRSRRLRRARR